MPKFKQCILITCALALCLPQFAQDNPKEAKDKQPELSSDDPIVIDAATGQMVAKGKARLEYGDLLLLADEIRYQKENGKATAIGNAILTFHEYRILADELVYELKDKNFSATEVRFGRYPLAGTSESLEGSLDGLSRARNATIFLFGPSPLEPNLTVRLLEYDAASGTLKAEKTRLRIGEQSLIGLPTIKTKRPESSIQPRLSAGHNDQLGASLEIGALFSVRPDLLIGGSLEGYTKRGLLVGPTLLYGIGESSLDGSLRSGFIEDQDPVGLDVQEASLSDSRGFLDWSHLQRINPNSSLAAQVQWRRDSEVFRDFRSESFHSKQWNDTFAEFTYSKGNTLTSVFARFQPNDFEDQIERKPEVGFHLLPKELFETGVYHSVTVELSSLEQHTGDNSAELESDRLDLTYHLMRRIQLSRWLSFTPSATYRMARYWDALGSDDSLSRHFGEFGLDARIPFHATFDVHNEIWEIDGLRHTGSFLFQYRYLDDSEAGDRTRVPLLDRRYFDPNLRPLDLREIRYLDDLDERNLLRFGIENRLQTRAKDYGSRDLAALRLYQDLLVDPDPGDDSLDEFYGEVDLRPAPWLALGLQAKMDVDKGDLRQLAIEATLLDADVSEASLSLLRMEDRSKQYRLWGLRRLDERRELQTGLQFDAQTGDLTRASLGVYSRFSDSWELVYMLTHRKGTAREDDLQFRMGVRVLAF
ncbi:MAG: LPS assembly protein LptD [Opitutales bacterium]